MMKSQFSAGMGGREVVHLVRRPLPMQTKPTCLQPLPPTFSGRYKRIIHLLSGFHRLRICVGFGGRVGVGLVLVWVWVLSDLA